METEWNNSFQRQQHNNSPWQKQGSLDCQYYFFCDHSGKKLVVNSPFHISNLPPLHLREDVAVFHQCTAISRTFSPGVHHTPPHGQTTDPSSVLCKGLVSCKYQHLLPPFSGEGNVHREERSTDGELEKGPQMPWGIATFLNWNIPLTCHMEKKKKEKNQQPPTRLWFLFFFFPPHKVAFIRSNL